MESSLLPFLPSEVENARSSIIYTHAPSDYICPFCLVVEGIENEHVLSKQDDVVFQDEEVTAFVSSRWWPDNAGHVLVIPNKHIENVYSMPTRLLGRVQEVAREVFTWV